MLTAEYNLVASGKGNSIVAKEDFRSLTYMNWFLGINSVTFADLRTKLECCAELSCSLVTKHLNSYQGSVSNTECLHVIRVYGIATTTSKKQIQIMFDNSRLFPVNNITHQIRFDIRSLAGDEIPADQEIIIHFSLYKKK
jgi:hypothetical protein